VLLRDRSSDEQVRRYKSGKPKTPGREIQRLTQYTHVELNNREKVGGSSLQTKAEATRTVRSHLQSNMKLRNKENASILLGSRQHDKDRARGVWRAMCWLFI
jgi:hypothetical protein